MASAAVPLQQWQVDNASTVTSQLALIGCANLSFRRSEEAQEKALTERPAGGAVSAAGQCIGTGRTMMWSGQREEFK